MLEGKAVMGETDMKQTMKADALSVATKALDCFDVTEPTQIARFIKKEFDRKHGSGWQCIAGTHFGSFVTHFSGCASSISPLEALPFCFLKVISRWTRARTYQSSQL